MQFNVIDVLKRNAELLGYINKIIHNFRKQNFDYALRMVTTVINHLNTLVELLITNADYFNSDNIVVDTNNIMNMLSSLNSAQANNDYILLADLYELSLQPLLLKIQNIITQNEGFITDDAEYLENINALAKKDKTIKMNYKSVSELLNKLDNGYTVEYTSCGLMTLALETNGKRFYFHSNNDVLAEAYTLANYWYSDEKKNYIIYGLGFGYHIKELFSIDKSINIEVYESDINIIQLACAFSDIGNIFSKTNIKLVYDPDFIKLSERFSNITDRDEILIHYPSLKNIKEISVKNKLENYFLEYSSLKNQLHLLNGNFLSNIECYNNFVDVLYDKFFGKDLFVIAAGPSLDNNFHELKNLNKDSIILATGTVFKKLINAGIKPDYIIVTDANERVYTQISGMENEGIPMLLLSTAYKGFAINYRAEKYIILQHGYNKSEEYAVKHGVRLYRTGGSVSTTALDLGISLGCKRIIFLGLDLAYTNNFVHALGTSRRDLTSTEDLRMIEDINGNTIYTSRSLDIFRQWIEKRIKDVKGIEFIDATEGGAKIKGMRVAKFEDVIKTQLL